VAGLAGQRRRERVPRDDPGGGGGERGRVVPGQVAGVGASGAEVRFAQDRGQQVAVGRDAVQSGPVEGPASRSAASSRVGP